MLRVHFCEKLVHAYREQETHRRHFGKSAGKNADVVMDGLAGRERNLDAVRILGNEWRTRLCSSARIESAVPADECRFTGIVCALLRLRPARSPQRHFTNTLEQVREIVGGPSSVKQLSA